MRGIPESWIQRVVAELRQPVRMDEEFDRNVMNVVRSLPRHRYGPWRRCVGRDGRGSRGTSSLLVRRRRQSLGRGPHGAPRHGRQLRDAQLRARRRRRRCGSVSWPTRAAIGLAGAWCVAIAAPRPASAQSDPELRLARLDAPTRVAVAAVVDSARKNRLPTEPLVDKALEGAKKGADGARIITAVRGLFSELRTARLALGTGATTDEINAGANALHAGLPKRSLAQLRGAAQHAGRTRVTLPLTVATDLVARDVPVAVASD